MLVLCASAAHAQGPQANAPSQTLTVQPGRDSLAGFTGRVETYAALRAELERGLPIREITTDSAAIRRAMETLAARIRAARASAQEGDVFTPAVAASVKQTLVAKVSTYTCLGIVDDNPGEFTHHVNDGYPDARTLSTVPPNVLAALPALPDDLQYRFVGRHLILLDARSGLIVDEVRYALVCRPCGSDPDWSGPLEADCGETAEPVPHE
jgi:hypothetical protein